MGNCRVWLHYCERHFEHFYFCATLTGVASSVLRNAAKFLAIGAAFCANILARAAATSFISDTRCQTFRGGVDTSDIIRRLTGPP